MITTETTRIIPLSSVKPLEAISQYRQFCIEMTEKQVNNSDQIRDISPVTNKKLIPWGKVGALEYLKCADTGSFFLKKVGSNQIWTQLLRDVADRRQSPNEFHEDISVSRASHVYRPKLEWMESVLRFQQVQDPSILEITTATSKFTPLLKSSRFIKGVNTVNEMELVAENYPLKEKYDAAILLENLDRVNDPKTLIEKVWRSLKPGGFVFTTNLVSSGYDVMVLGLENLYIYPPDRTNCFSLRGLEILIENAGFELIEKSTPGVLDLEIVQQHRQKNKSLVLSPFEELLTQADEATQQSFQSFLQKSGLSSFARIAGRKNGKR